MAFEHALSGLTHRQAPQGPLAAVQLFAVHARTLLAHPVADSAPGPLDRRHRRCVQQVCRRVNRSGARNGCAADEHISVLWRDATLAERIGNIGHLGE